ncbi:restriction endonuclease subunit S [Mycoplasma sp. Z473B]|uniref:restriction endonuclease subunit S n=1 Tax=Mycoplasma sp. Z473B TaxID=3401667 RepID=UPI003AAE4187
MKKEKLVPEIRFKGFEEDWRNKKIESFGIWLPGTSLENQFCKNGSHKVVNIGSFGPDFMYKDQGLRINLNDENKHFLLKKDDLVMILNDKTLEGRIIGSVLLIDKDNTYLYNQRIQRLSIDKLNYNPHYLFSLINNMRNHDILYKKSQGNTQIYLNWSVVSKINFLVSEQLDEQQKIGTFFSNLDSFIQSQKLKLKKLNEVKQSFLSKMFASENQKFPEIRFKGFKEEWKLTTFDELINFASEGGTPSTFNNEFYKNGNIPFIKIEETKNKYIFDAEIYINIHGINNSSAWVIPPNSILLTNGATIGNVAINKKEICTKQGILGIIPSLSMDLEFFYYLLKNKYFQKELKNKSVTGTFASISLPIIKTILLSVSQKDEQQKIGQFFLNLDSLIQSQELKLEKLNNIKQALLEKMFC